MRQLLNVIGEFNNASLKNVTNVKQVWLRTEKCFFFNFCSKRVFQQIKIMTLCGILMNKTRHNDMAVLRINLSTLNQQMITSNAAEQSSSSDTDLLLVLVSSDSPLQKLNSVHFKRFLKKFINRGVPHESRLHRNSVPRCFQDVMFLIFRVHWSKKNSTYETTGAVTAGRRLFLLNIEILDGVNHSSIEKFLNASLIFLWPERVCYDHIY